MSEIVKARESAPFDPRVFRRDLIRVVSALGAGEPSVVEKLVFDGLEGSGDEALALLHDRLTHTGEEWGFYPHDPIARRISRAALGVLSQPGSGLEGAEHLAITRGRPVFYIANHLSYIDVNVLDSLLHRAGAADAFQPLTVLIGPKVYATPIRRLASLCFGTIKIPQSTSRASGEAVMPRREVARLALETLRNVDVRRTARDHLFVFPEGSRSRTGRMCRFLPAAARYFEAPETCVVPIGLFGSERMMPLDAERAAPAVVRARIGAPVEAKLLFERADHRRPVVADALGFLVADVLPPEYRGEYAQAGEELALARAAASSARG